MLKNKKIILIILVSVIFFGFLFFRSGTPPSPVATLDLSYENTSQDTTTVYDFMDRLQNNGEITFTEKNYAGMGKFIVEINGVKGDGEKNWIYYVNGKKASVGVSNYKINKGDIVSWKYENIY